MDNQTDVSIKFKNSVTGEKKLEKYVQTLSQIKSVLGSIDKGAMQQMEQTAKGTQTVNKDMEKMSKNFNLAFNYTALRAFARGLGHVVEGFSAMTAKSTAFLEDFNLFQVAFRGNYTEATRFVNKLSEMYGLDEDWLIRTTSQFKQLSNAMGLANETGEKVSKLMTQMAIDISSLYNIDVDRSSSILQSALAGQTKPVRSLGADITQATLQQTLDRLDIGKQVSQLSYAEKRLLIMISLTQQLSGVTNDWGRTLESPSNQIRIMNEQWQRLQRNVGNIFLQVIGKVLPYLNAVLMVLNEIAKIIAALFGHKLDDFDFFDEGTIGGIEGGFDDLGDSMDSAADSAKKLKQGLRGFDKLNVITTPSDGGAGGAGGIGGGGGISSGLMDAFNKAFDDYNKKLSEVQMKATRIRDKIMEWLGFTKVVDEETGEVSFKFDHITGGTVLGALAVGGAIYKGISTVYKWLKRLGIIDFKGFTSLAKLFKDGTVAKNMATFSKGINTIAQALGMSSLELGLAAAAFVAIGVAVVHAYNHIEEFKNKVDTAFGSVSTLVKTILGKFEELGKKLKPILDPIIDIIKFPFEQAWKNLETIFGMMYDGVVGTFSAIADTVDGVAKIITDIINLDFGQAFKDLIHLAENLYGDWQTWWDKITKRFTEWKDDLKVKWDNFIDDVKRKVEELPQKVEEFPERFGIAIGEAVKKIKEKIDNTNWEELGKKIVDGIVNGIIANMFKFSQTMNTLPFQILIGIGNLSGDLWYIGIEIINAITRGMVGFIANGGLSGVAKGIVNGLKESLGIHSPAKLILDAKIGDFSMEAITLGMERQLPKLNEEAQNIVDTLKSGIKEASVDSNFTYDIPPFNPNTMTFGVTSAANNNVGSNTSINPTIIVQVGNKEIAKQVIADLQDMAKDNGKPITIGG